MIKFLSTVNDVFVDFEEVYPKAIALQFIKNGQYFYTDWNQISSIEPQKGILNQSPDLGRSRTFPVIKKR